MGRELLRSLQYPKPRSDAASWQVYRAVVHGYPAMTSGGVEADHLKGRGLLFLGTLLIEQYGMYYSMVFSIVWHNGVRYSRLEDSRNHGISRIVMFMWWSCWPTFFLKARGHMRSRFSLGFQGCVITMGGILADFG